jgi:MmyB-like transcription regulator ligand binding domain
VRPGANLIRATFLEPEIRQRLSDWDMIAHMNVARLRALAGAEVDSPRLVELVEEVSARSSEFRELRARHDIEVTEPPCYVFDHPLVGRLMLYPALLAVGEHGVLHTVTCRAGGVRVVIVHVAGPSAHPRGSGAG